MCMKVHHQHLLDSLQTKGCKKRVFCASDFETDIKLEMRLNLCISRYCRGITLSIAATKAKRTEKSGNSDELEGTSGSSININTGGKAVRKRSECCISRP